MARQSDWIDHVEGELVHAWQMLLRLPDRERGWLSAGSRSGWPQIVRERFGDYPDEEAREPRRALGRREMELLGRVFGIDGRDGYLMERIALANRPLVALVLARKAGRQPGGFQWNDIWQALGGKALGIGPDALRARWDRCLGMLAASWPAAQVAS